MDRLDELALFAAIVEEGSLAAAARRLGHSAPAVTRALTRLETRLGARLLERTTRRSQPTEAGRRLAEQARRLLTEYEAALNEAAGSAGGLHGRLRIGAPLVFGRRHLAPLLPGFLTAHPGLRAELTLSDRFADLVEEELDLALRIGSLPASGLHARRVGGVRRILAAAPAYLAAHGTPETPSALAGHAAVLSTGFGARDWRFRLPEGREVTLRPSARLTVNEAEAAITAAEQGLGLVSALSYQLANSLAAGRLVRLLAAYEMPPLPVQFVFPELRLMPARVRAFLDWAAPRLSALPVLRPG
jgi:molybdate transport repressor ModE-like protein